ncbi:SVB-like [Hibiscus trionum]|uniref:SVB-like n=1 Tax=Hibiscus trionum TaxID=183268 RepID=A0A9W7JAM9_HIBTR|nr:SVB-like [Hibiscus trionum]
MSLVTEEIKASASEIYNGDEMCQEKSKFLLEEIGMPRGLLPLKDIEECGYVKDTGFVWLKQKKSITHKFDKIGRLVCYATEVTAVVEKNKIKKLTGVKTKELLVWITLSDISVDDPPTGKITFKTPAGLYRTFPVSAFEIEGEAVKEKNKEEQEANAAAAAAAAAAAVGVKEV